MAEKPTIKKPVEKATVKVDKTTEKIINERDERFKRVALKRANSVIERLTMLGSITSNPQNYDFSREQIDLVFEPIEKLTAQLRQKFYDCLSKDELKEEYLIREL